MRRAALLLVLAAGACGGDTAPAPEPGPGVPRRAFFTPIPLSPPEHLRLGEGWSLVEVFFRGGRRELRGVHTAEGERVVEPETVGDFLAPVPTPGGAARVPTPAAGEELVLLLTGGRRLDAAAHARVVAAAERLRGTRFAELRVTLERDSAAEGPEDPELEVHSVAEGFEVRGTLLLPFAHAPLVRVDARVSRDGRTALHLAPRLSFRLEGGERMLPGAGEAAAGRGRAAIEGLLSAAADPRRTVAAVREVVAPGLALAALAERLGAPDRELGSETRLWAWDLADGSVLVAAQSAGASAIQLAARVEFARRDARGMTKIGAELERLVPR